MENIKSRLKILQFGLINTSDVPRNYMRMFQENGYYCRMVTLKSSPNEFPEDICLNWYSNKKTFLDLWRSYKIKSSGRSKNNFLRLKNNVTPKELPPVFKYHNLLEQFTLQVRDRFRRSRAKKDIEKWNLNDFDIYHFHDGIEFTRDGKWIRSLAEKGKKIICNYHGQDLRERGIIPAVDKCSQLNLTNEFDLLSIHPVIHYIPIPFRAEDYPYKEIENKRLKIIHTPSIIAYKGTELIIETLKKLAGERQIDFEIITGRPHSEVIEKKKNADIAIEQIGNIGGTGYGVNSLENLAMGITTVTEFTSSYKEFLKDHPFILATAEDIYQKLIDIVDNSQKRKNYKIKGRKWVLENHSYKTVFDCLKELYKSHSIAVDL